MFFFLFVFVWVNHKYVVTQFKTEPVLVTTSRPLALTKTYKKTLGKKPLQALNSCQSLPVRSFGHCDVFCSICTRFARSSTSPRALLNCLSQPNGGIHSTDNSRFGFRIFATSAWLHRSGINDLVKKNRSKVFENERKSVKTQRVCE